MDDIHAHGKTERGLAWRHDHPDAKPLLIGDTDHDAAVAKAMGIDFALFAGGHQSKKQLLACEPIRVLDNLGEVLELLQIGKAARFCNKKIPKAPPLIAKREQRCFRDIFDI